MFYKLYYGKFQVYVKEKLHPQIILKQILDIIIISYINTLYVSLMDKATKKTTKSLLHVQN